MLVATHCLELLWAGSAVVFLLYPEGNFTAALHIHTQRRIRANGSLNFNQTLGGSAAMQWSKISTSPTEIG